MRRITHIGQAGAATLGVVAAAAAWAADRTVRLPAAATPSEAEAAVLSLTEHPTAATVGGFAKVLAATGLAVAVAAFCYRPASDALPGSPRWAPPTALACLAAWTATVAVAAALRGALARLAARSPDDATVRLGLDFADYLGALGLVLLAAGALHLVVAAAWRVSGDPPPTGTVTAVAVVAGVVTFVAGAVAVLSAPRLPEAGRSSDANMFEPGTAVHGVVTVTWVLLLIALAVDGWRPRRSSPEQVG